MYSATHPTLKRKVVLKKLNLRGNRQHYERFRQEAALMMDLNHDNIVRVYDHFKEGSKHYIVMEFVEGCSLDTILKKGGPLPPGAARYVLESCCRALAYIHSRNIIHRDIKPSNIFISATGDVKLGDFGIAQLESANESSGEFVPIGTPSYMAPEQFLPHAKISSRTDIYALGVTLYEILTGKKLFDGETLDELKRNILRSHHPSLFSLVPSMGIVLYRIVAKSTRKRPGFRYAAVMPVRKLLRFVAPKVKNPDAVAVLQVLAGAAGGGSVSSKKKPLPSHPSIPHKGTRSVNTLILILFSVAVLAGTSLFFVRTGAFYRTFYSRSKGALQIQVLSGDESFPHTGDLNLYRDKVRYLEPIRTLDLSENRGFSDIFYLDTGNYRIMVRWGSQVEWILFYLPPMAHQKDVLILDVNSPVIPRKPLIVQTCISNAMTNQDLGENSVVSVQFEDGKWSELKNQELETGHAYRLKVECPGFYPRYLNTPLQFYQDRLDLQVQMIPLPGVLKVANSADRLTLLVNGEKYLPGGGENRDIVKFGRIEEGAWEWVLSPGVYNLRWKSGESVVEESLSVETSGIYEYSLRKIDDRLIVESD